MNNTVTISFPFPIININSGILQEYLNVKTRGTAESRLRELGVDIRGKGKNQYVSIVDVIEAFNNLGIELTSKKYSAKSEEAQGFIE